MRISEQRGALSATDWATLLAELPLVVVILNADAHVISAGEVAPELVHERAVGMSFFDYVGPTAAEPAQACLASVRRTLAPDHYVASYAEPTLEQRWYEARVAPRLEDGQLAGFTVAAFDVTDRVLAERREAEARLATERLRERIELLLGLADLYMWEWIPELDFVHRSGAREGEPPGFEVEGYRDFIERVLPDDRAKVEAAATLALTEGRPFVVEYRVKSPDGLRWLLARGRAERGPDGRVTSVFGVTLDNTERRRDEELRRGLQQRVERGQRVESLGRLAGGIAHEFNNLLQMILGTAHMLALPGLSEGQSRDLQMIVEAAHRGAELTRQILAFARNDRMVYERTQLDELITRTLELLSRVLPENVALHFEPGAGGGELQLDRGRIEQVLMNLCLNARDSMPEGGTLRIRSERVRVGEGGSPVGTPPGDYAVVHVSDTGCGMPREVLERAFDPFFTTKPPGQGTGLGLSVAQSIVHKHGGVIAVSSGPGAGSEFSVYLPRPERVEQQPRASEAGPSGRTILVVDDEPIVRDVIGRVLEQAGFSVLFAEDGQAAVDRFREDAGKIDLVIMDAIMPRMGGQAAAARILELRPDTNLMFLSGYSSSELDENFLVQHRLTVLTKPVTPSELLAVVRERLEHGTPGAREASS